MTSTPDKEAEKKSGEWEDAATGHGEENQPVEEPVPTSHTQQNMAAQRWEKVGDVLAKILLSLIVLATVAVITIPIHLMGSALLGDAAWVLTIIIGASLAGPLLLMVAKHKP